jgi:hypothetical protein
VKKLLTTLAVLLVLMAPAIFFMISHHEIGQPVWQEDPEEIYLKLLERELLSGNLTRAQFIDRLIEKAILSGRAPLPAESFINLYTLAEDIERLRLKALIPYVLKEAAPTEAQKLREFQKN